MGTTSQKVLTLVNGRTTEVASVKDSAGNADADKLVALGTGGKIDDSMLNSSTTGAPGALAKLDGNGRLNTALLPTGIGADVAVLTASEALAAGDLVNVYNNAGVGAVRKADGAAVGKEAHGFVLSAVASGGQATVYFEGTNDQVTGLTPGTQFLSGTTPGKTSSTSATGSGKISQIVGFATSPTSLNFNSGPAVTLA